MNVSKETLCLRIKYSNHERIFPASSSFDFNINIVIDYVIILHVVKLYRKNYPCIPTIQ